MKGKIHSIETFGSVDGPGIRTVFFMQGCPARCLYCHNPDSWSLSQGIAVTSEELVNRAKRGKSYYGDDGGVTFSGGEPLLQGEFLIATMKKLKMEGIKSAIDTSGTYYDENTFDVIKESDLVLLDIKHTEADKFAEITACAQENLFKVIDDIKELKKPVWIRQVIIPGINDSEEYIEKLNDFIADLNTVNKVELLGYHKMAIDKYNKLDMEYRLKDTPAMEKDRMEELRTLIKVPKRKVKVAV
ncbi:MAG TPA: pyruvate formate-lyase-activating protein [Anaerovoracaceae bacterium]|nr:pyruvate formate-lyase-activating protein [Anaerovoracaceae bacterium]